MSETVQRARVALASGHEPQPIELFAAECREDVRALASVSPRVAELATSFPGLLFALATGHGTASQRRVVAEMVINGAPLRDSAEALGLPYWLRKLSPAAFTPPMPQLPDAPGLGLRLLNHIPVRPHRQGHWLRMIERAIVLGDEEFAIWLASRRDLMVLVNIENDIAPLALYAWLSSHAPETVIGRLMERPWSADMQLEAAIRGCDRFLFRLAIEVLISRPVSDTWGQAAVVDGYVFQPIDRVDRLIEEAAEMHNCARRYIFKIAMSESRLFSVRDQCRRVATLELVPSKRNGRPLIHQIKGRCNGPVPRSVREAAGRWRQAHVPVGVRVEPEPLIPNARLWRALVAPYEAAKGIDLIAARSPGLADMRGFITKLSGFGARAAVLLWLPEERG